VVTAAKTRGMVSAAATYQQQKEHVAYGAFGRRGGVKRLWRGAVSKPAAGNNGESKHHSWRHGGAA